MYIFLLITLVRAQIKTGIISVVNLLQNETQKYDVKYEEFQFIPQISYSLVGIQIDTDLPRQLAFRPKLQTITKNGFRFLVIGGPTIINYLEFQWWAVNDDRLKLGCQHFDELGELNSVKDLAVTGFSIPFDRFFSNIPQVQIYLAGISKISQKQDLSFSMKISTVNRDSFDLQVQKKSAHRIDGLDICYVASNDIEVKSINKVDQRADEFIDFEGLEGNFFYGVSRISHHYGILMVQLGETDIEDSQVGINQIDISIAELPQTGFMSCAIGYFKCNYQGTPVYLCDTLDNWRMLKSVRIVKGAQKILKIGGGKYLDISQSFDCIKNINSILKDEENETQNVSSTDELQANNQNNLKIQASPKNNNQQQFIQFSPPPPPQSQIDNQEKQIDVSQNDLLGDDLDIFQKYINQQSQSQSSQTLQAESEQKHSSHIDLQESRIQSFSSEESTGLSSTDIEDEVSSDSNLISVPQKNKKPQVQADQSLSKLEQLLKHDNENYYTKYQKQSDDKGNIILKQKWQINKSSTSRAKF